MSNRNIENKSFNGEINSSWFIEQENYFFSPYVEGAKWFDNQDDCEGLQTREYNCKLLDIASGEFEYQGTGEVYDQDTLLDEVQNLLFGNDFYYY